MGKVGAKSIRVAVVASAESSFVRTDCRLLSEHFTVRYVPWNGKRSIPPLALAILRTDVVFSWFALDHAYAACRLARLLRRRSIAFVGGVDAAKRPDLGYGVYLDPRKGSLARYALLHSDRVLVVDDALREDIRRNAGVDRADVVTVNLGFDTTWFSPDDGPRANVLTVGIVDDVNVRRKGLLTFMEVARLLPDRPFVLVGGRANEATERLRALAPANVRILGHVDEAELREQYRRARVYLQLSDYEAFGSALGEAMACGCVPVGTRVGGIPTLIDATGWYAPYGDAGATAKAIEAAFASGHGDAARRRIVEGFSLRRRQEALERIVESLVARGRSH